MNAPFHQAQAGAVAAELDALAPPPLLLPGESLERYQFLRQAILMELAPRSAIEHTLRQVDLTGIPPEFVEDASRHIRHNARAWRTDPKTANEIEARLLADGFDQQSINVEVYLQAREIFLIFEGLIASAHNRRTSLLREIDNRRYSLATRRVRLGHQEK